MFAKGADDQSLDKELSAAPSEKYDRGSGGRAQADAESRLEILLGAPAPKAPRREFDIFSDVLVSLKSILSPEQFEVLEHELSIFSEEYRYEHYTACALRIGRTLEHVVYALASAWGVNINRTTLKVLSDLNNSFDELTHAFIAYTTTDESEKSKRKKAVQDKIKNVSDKLYKVVWDLDSDLRPEATGVPVNVESILRDIRRQFARRNKVLNAVNEIMKEDIFRKILDIRNDAAHASTSGVRRELSKADIDVAVEHLRTALFLFCNIAFAVAEKE